MPSVPPDEQMRLAALRSLGLLDTGHEERFDRITRLAAALLDAPIALVTLVDGERHWFKSAFGIDVVESPRDSLSFCGRAIQSDAQFVVPDTRADPHFAGSPLVTGDAGIRFYAGRPLKAVEGSRVGTLCVMDRKPHKLTAAQSALLEDLAAIAEDELNHVRHDSALRTRIAAIVENSNDGIYSRKLDGTVLSWNAGAERMLGYTAAEAIGQSITRSLPTGHRPRLAEHNAALLRGQVIAHESTRKSKDGRIVDVWASVSPIRDGAGNVTGASVILQDISALKQVERTQAQLAAIVETTNDAIVGRAPDDTIISWNAAAERMFGWTAAEVLGKSFRTLLSLTPEASKRKRFEKALRGETAGTAEDTRRRKDGSSVIVDTTLSAVKNANGEILFVSCIMRDVTERKRVEESRAQLAAIVENSNDAIYSRTLDGTILSWNGGAEKMLGYAAAEAIGNSTSIILPSDRPQYLPENNKAVLRGEVYVRNSNRITKDGRILDVVSSHSPIFDASGNIKGVAVILRDVTALKRAQAALQESEERFRLTFDQAAAGMVLIGLDQRYIIANQKFANMTGYTCAELQGMPTASIGYAGDSDEVTVRQQQQLLDGEIDSINAERRFVRKDGKVFSVRRTLSLARDATGKPLYFVGMSEDITERREMEERYRATFDNAPVGIMHTAIDGYTILHANRKLCEMLGYTLDELLHMTSTDLVHPEFRFKDLPRYKNPLIRGEFASFSSERKYLRKNGSVIWVKRTLSLVNDATGTPLYFIRIVEDITERKQAEEARSRLAAVAEGSADAIFIRDVQGKIVFWNEAAARIYGYRPEEVMGKSSDFLVPPEWLKERRINWERLQQGIPVENFETVRRRKDGALLDMSISVSVVKDPHGNLIGAATVARDITERKQAEAVRGYLAAIVNSSNDAIISRSLERKVLSWNNAAERLFGYTASEVIGTDVSFLIPPDREAEARVSRERVNSGLPVVNLETVRLTKGGQRIDVTMSQSSVIDERGSMIGVALIFRDNSERKRASAERALLATIVENANDAIVSRTLDNTILSWNAAAERMFGYTAAEAIGQPITIILPQGLEYMVADHSRLIALGKPVPLADVAHTTKAGKTLPVRRSISPIRNAAQQVIGAAIIMQDISALKQAEETRSSLEAQLRESQKMQAIGTLAGGIAHDFNNIIAIVLGNLDLARQDAAHVPRVLESLERIQLASERARSLVQQILAFSRRQPTTRVPVNLATVVTETERLLYATMPARIHFSVDCDPATPQVLADAMQIQQVLINLATNAMQALHDNTGHITLQLDSVVLDERMIESHTVLREMRARHPGAVVRLSVRDDGTGMDANTLARVFEPFFTTRPAGEGTGLGLSVVLGIVQAHDGVITVESRPQQGTTFTLYFPPATSPAYASSTIAQPAGATATVDAPVATSDARPKAHVLYIDDDDDLAFLMKRLLERRGYRISTYIDPRDALAALAADPADVDLVLTDYNMPGMSGLDVARAVRDIRADIQIAVTSGFIDETLQSQAASAGVAKLIFKADSVEVLCDAVQRLVDNGKAT